jgi:hypothetical protein
MLDAMARRTSQDIPADLRARLETARLDLLALFRALDRMHLTQQIPQRFLRQLFELPCCATLRRHWINSPQPAPDSAKHFHSKLMPHFPNWNSLSARS